MTLGHWHNVFRRCGASKAEHSYAPHYERLLGPLANEPINLLEIGVCAGGSLKAWLELFPKGYIYGVDVAHRVPWVDPRCTICLCNQADPHLANLFPRSFFDVIVDDGSHVHGDQTRARESLWRSLRPGGWYCIEDILDLNDLKYWATFSRFAVFLKHLRRIDPATECFDDRHSLDDVLVVLRKEPCPPAWEW